MTWVKISSESSLPLHRWHIRIYFQILLLYFHQNATRGCFRCPIINKLALVQVMAWCGQATSHHLDRCRLSLPTPYAVTRPQCVNDRRIPLTKSSHVELDVFFDVSPNKRLSKQSRCRWFGTPLRSLWHHCNGIFLLFSAHRVSSLQWSLRQLRHPDVGLQQFSH